ncbi:hypothetical protein D3C76_776440 [compost metagenome]
MLLQVLDHLTAMLDIGFDAPVGNLAVGHGLDISNRLCGRVTAAKGLDAMVIGDPDTPTRHRRGAAILGAFFDHQGVEAKIKSAQCSGHPARPRADHQNIAALIPLDLGIIHAITSRRAHWQKAATDRKPAAVVLGIVRLTRLSGHRPMRLRRRRAPLTKIA